MFTEASQHKTPFQRSNNVILTSKTSYQHTTTYNIWFCNVSYSIIPFFWKKANQTDPLSLKKAIPFSHWRSKGIKTLWQIYIVYTERKLPGVSSWFTNECGELDFAGNLALDSTHYIIINYTDYYKAARINLYIMERISQGLLEDREVTHTCRQTFGTSAFLNPKSS